MGGHLGRRLLFLSIASFSLAALPSPSLAQTRPPPSLTQVSIEDLMNIDVTSVSRKEQRASDVAAAIFVITHEDILRSGMTSITDVLRLAPGVDVAQVNSNRWAVTVRGFNSIFANKLLVLVDGRSVYNRVYSGVFWDAQDLMLDDIERIEVIRGPAAALWGANAVNGVINIVTRTAAQTAGAFARVDAGGFGEQAAIRYGGRLGAVDYRVFAQVTGRQQSRVSAIDSTGANDASHSISTGFRADWSARPGQFTLESAIVSGESHALWPNLSPATAASQPIVNDPSDATSTHLLGRWTRTTPSGASIQVQSFVDVARRNEPVGNFRRHAFDIDTQFHATIGARQDVVAGAGYRFVGETFLGRGGFSLTPSVNRASLITAFVQDEISLAGSRLALTLGTQWQYDSDFGAGLQPTARLMWKALPHQRFWVAASRAIRTPSLTDVAIQVTYPPVPSGGGPPLVVTLKGNPAFTTESFTDLEAGYRVELGSTASIDITGFTGEYDHLRTQEPAAPVLQFVPAPQILVAATFANLQDATTRGVEIIGRWSPVPGLRLDASYTAFHLSPHLAPTSRDPLASADDGSVPNVQWHAGAVWSPTSRAVLNVALFHSGALHQVPVPAYTRADVTAEWHFTSAVSLMIVGQNLLDDAHVEFSTVNSALSATAIPRAINLRLRWMFR